MYVATKSIALTNQLWPDRLERKQRNLWRINVLPRTIPSPVSYLQPGYAIPMMKSHIYMSYNYI